MQIQSLRIKSYRSWKVDDRVYSDVAKKKFKLLQDFEKLRAGGGSESVILSVLGISRSTFYRIKAQYDKRGFAGLEPGSKRPHQVRKPRWDNNLENLVLKLRKQEPTWGKNKPKRRRVFNKHASRWKYGMKATKPGELVQIDHMTVWSNSKAIKHFKAICPVSKFMVCEVYANANSRTAAEFLRKVLTEMPFNISSIQVDGGSEFMRDFEDLCKELDVKLLVLPPRSPKLNGNVERCNGVTRDDFYSQYNDVFNVTTIRGHLRLYQSKFNGYRPHQALHNLTPLEYLHSLDQNKAA